MRIGLTYDLRADYLALGLSLEETAEFDKEETIAGIEDALRALGHTTERIGHARALIRRLEAGERWNLVFNICEGLRGVAREAQVPAILELYEVPYVFSDPLVLALTLHKGMTKRVVRDAGIPTSDFLVYETDEDLAELRFGAPFFVKPVAEGTGKGCSAKSVVRERAALAAVCDDLVARFRQPALIEPYLPGREFTVGITGTGRQAAVAGSMEIVLLPHAEAGGYSFDNKGNYEDRVVYPATDPARDPVAAMAERIALDAWRALGCRDGGRVDLRCDASGRPQFLEVNPLAGLNPKDSDLPILARQCGITYTELIGRILDSAIQRQAGG
ncbi:MAG TPA: D-alanine--D-alanine ligase [Kiritimatiellia bacterium]|jgi:D-alanine-D-alanine ligase|nr:D-alanine--D-alanine ligase [Kiritimatiellia bacterium]HOR98290.1 D-alanine--D-alanine ligase [Kiritimatiellia bacterium]HPC48817.1 D-alanine--D-alanine ligase [Kiritimatiellia bacterium]HPK37548.1 D-alanine--D-alanine ligase [Kiritimatiellia bacterium]HPW75840.1 D-alanine--D-alanine ligase [Kiritimatiellia bacterium]